MSSQVTQRAAGVGKAEGVPLLLREILRRHKLHLAKIEEAKEESVLVQRSLLDGLIPAARDFVLDKNRRKVLICARQVGKTWTLATYALLLGEQNPGGHVVVISLSYEQLRRNLWEGDSGIVRMAERNGLKLEYNNSRLTWTHPNGCTGYLIAAEEIKSAERIRGMSPTAFLIDEAGVFGPRQFQNLISNVVMPSADTKLAPVILSGTPGPALVGDFYFLSSPGVTSETEGYPKSPSVYYSDVKDSEPLPGMWNVHTWGVKDNIHVPHKWQEWEERIRANGWNENHPTVLRERDGKWAADDEHLVSAFSGARLAGTQLFYDPEPATVTGLPPDWNFVYGLSIGLEAETGVVVAAYSTASSSPLRIVEAHRESGLDMQGSIGLLRSVQERYGDGLVVATVTKEASEAIAHQYGVPVVPADTHNKYDAILTFNTEIRAGRIQFSRNGCIPLVDELESLVWDLSKGRKEVLARRKALKFKEGMQEQAFNATLCLFRYVSHYLGGNQRRDKPAWGTAEWYQELEKKRKKQALRQLPEDYELDSPFIDERSTQKSVFDELQDSLDDGRSKFRARWK